MIFVLQLHRVLKIRICIIACEALSAVRVVRGRKLRLIRKPKPIELICLCRRLLQFKAVFNAMVSCVARKLIHTVALTESYEVGILG
jgi:hypothetical protein